MSAEQLKAFLEAVKTDSTLQAQLKAAADEATDVEAAMVAIAKSAGFEITVDEWMEKQLEGVVGGTWAVGSSTGSTPGVWWLFGEDPR